MLNTMTSNFSDIVQKSVTKFEIYIIEKFFFILSFFETNKKIFIAIISRDMGFPTMWYVRPAKPQISLRIRAVWSEPLLAAWIVYEC